MPYRPFKAQVVRLLKERDWYQADLAEAMGITPGRISHIFRGDEAVTRETIEKVADVFGVKPTHFDLYIRFKLFELAPSVPGLIEIGRNLSEAKNDQQFMRIAAKIA